MTQVSERARGQALERLRLLQPHLENGVPLSRVAREHSIALRTAERWLRQYRQHGLVGLAPKGRSDRGRHRMPSELQQLIEGLALRQARPSAASVYRQVRTVAEARQWRVPSYSTVYAVMRALDPALVTLAQQGSKAYRERFDLLYRREAGRPNEIWQADHTPLDIWILDERGQPARPWLTSIIDDYSRVIAGFRVGFEAPSILRTALTLRQAIWRKGDARWDVCGIPEVFYTDHGSDFTSNHLEQVAAELRIQLVFSEPGMPRGRGRIERFFETVNQLCLCTLPGYTPPETTRARAVLTLEELDLKLTEFLLGDYHYRIHSETGVRPRERWQAGGFLPRLPDSLEQLDLLLLTVPKPRVVHQDGIHFQRLRYLDLTLAAYVGETVTIRYDPRDLAEIRVYHGDQFICRAICQELADQTISLKELIRARNARRRQLREHIAARTNIADQLLPLARSKSRAAVATVDGPAEPPPLKRYVNE